MLRGSEGKSAWGPKSSHNNSDATPCWWQKKEAVRVNGKGAAECDSGSELMGLGHHWLEKGRKQSNRQGRAVL